MGFYWDLLTRKVTTMLVLATAVLLVSSVLAADDGLPTQPCDIPPRWTAQITDLKSQDPIATETTYSQDTMMRVERTTTRVRATGEIVNERYTDFNKTKVYNWARYGPDAGKCVESASSTEYFGGKYADLKKFVKQYRYEGNGTLGGPTGLTYDAWSMSLTDGNELVVALSRKSCVPVLENLRNLDPSMGFEHLYLFNDVTTKVDDSMFRIPGPCEAISGGIVG